MKKITKSTLKAFINKAFENLFVKVESDFDPYTDCLENIKKPWKKATIDNDSGSQKYTLGINDIWITSSTNYRIYKDNTFIGIYWFNCCGSGMVAVKQTDLTPHLKKLLGL